MLVNFLKRHSSNIKQLGRKPQDKDDVHAIKQEEMIESDDTRTHKEHIKDYFFTNKFSRHRNKRLNCANLGIHRLEEDSETVKNIPRLSHGLERVLKGGLYKQNFGVEQIYHPDVVDMQRLDLYMVPTKDPRLMTMAHRCKAKYIMSTSTIGSSMSHLCYILGCFRSPRFDLLSSALDPQPKKLMISNRKPVTVIFKPLGNGIYGVDSDKGPLQQKTTILMQLGKIMESQLMLTDQQFRSRYIIGEQMKDFVPEREHHRFMLLNNQICLRSQIDGCSESEDGKPFVFEIKTRATSPIRYNLSKYLDYLDYELKTDLGRYESFQREYYDLIRGAFIKYGFQMKVGGMDGALVAYHNTQRIYGYQYIRNTEILKRIFGNELNSQAMFIVSAKMLTTVYDYILANVHEECKAYRVGFYANSLSSSLTVFVECCKQDPSDIPLVPMSKDIKDETDYYLKHKENTNQIYKFDFVFTMVVNGVTMNSPYLLYPGDDLQVYYDVVKHAPPTLMDYMNFLHESYMYENILADFSYAGAWVRNRHDT